MVAAVTQQSVLAEKRGALGLLTLNRPAALHALDLGMIRSLHVALHEWRDNPQVRAVVVRSTGPNAFCAGGDIRALATHATRSQDTRANEGDAFLSEEYALNHRIRHYPKPYVALVDGLCMGGGLGISAHGSHRVVSERLVLAMPETAIGLFPDVGAGFFLPRFPGKSGLYLGLTGARASAADASWLGYATAQVPSAHFEALLEALCERSASAEPITQVIEACIDRFRVSPAPSELATLKVAIDRCFAAASLPSILERLDTEPGEWAGRTRALLETRCPISLVVTLRQLRAGRHLSYTEVALLEHRLARRLIRRSDFPEGVRAALLDRDGKPRWSPARLQDIAAEDVEALFAPSAQMDAEMTELLSRS